MYIYTHIRIYIYTHTSPLTPIPSLYRAALGCEFHVEETVLGADLAGGWARHPLSGRHVPILLAEHGEHLQIKLYQYIYFNLHIHKHPCRYI